jgi:DNA-binding Lrp family transcriptional regulator
MIDELDLKIIVELQRDGRQTNIELARKLGVVEGTVRKRVKALQKNNFMRIVAVPNLYDLGYRCISTIAIQVQLKFLRKVAESLAAKPNVVYVACVAGRYDLLVMVITPSSNDISAFIENEITPIPGIVRTETFVNMDVIKGGWKGIDTTQIVNNLKIPPKPDSRSGWSRNHNILQDKSVSRR